MTNSRMTNLGWPPLTNFSNHRIISEGNQNQHNVAVKLAANVAIALGDTVRF